MLSSLAGTGASAYSSSILNQQNPDFANDNHERRAKSGGYAPSGFESMGEISFHRNGEETHIALVDIDGSLLQQNLQLGDNEPQVFMPEQEQYEEVIEEQEPQPRRNGKGRAPEQEQEPGDRRVEREDFILLNKGRDENANLLFNLAEEQTRGRSLTREPTHSRTRSHSPTRITDTLYEQGTDQATAEIIMPPIK